MAHVHVHGAPDNQEDNLNDILGRGKGDPDAHGYPGEDDRRWIGNLKPRFELHRGESELLITNDDGTTTISEVPF